MFEFYIIGTINCVYSVTFFFIRIMFYSQGCIKLQSICFHCYTLSTPLYVSTTTYLSGLLQWSFGLVPVFTIKNSIAMNILVLYSVQICEIFPGLECSFRIGIAYCQVGASSTLLGNGTLSHRGWAHLPTYQQDTGVPVVKHSGSVRLYNFCLYFDVK